MSETKETKMNLKIATPSQIDAELEKAYIAKDRADSLIANYERRIKRQGALNSWDQEHLDGAEEASFHAIVKIGNIAAEFASRGGWERAFLVTNGNGHVHRSLHCSTCFPTTRYAWMTELSGKTEAEIIGAIGDKACTICYPDAPVAKLTTAERKSRARAEVEARKAEKAEIKRQKELAKVPRAHAAAIKVDALIEAFGLDDPDGKAYGATWGEGPFGKGYDTAYQTYSDMQRRRSFKSNR